MASKTISFLKNSNYDFNNILDSYLSINSGDTQTVASTATFTGNSVMRRTDAVANAEADLSVTEALHAGRTIMQTDASADRTYTIAAPSSAGVKYHFVGQGSGTAADGHDIIIKTTDNTEFFDGAITFLDTDNEVSGIWGNGTNHDQLQINVPATYDIHICAASTTVWYIWGTVTGATAPAFSNG